MADGVRVTQIYVENLRAKAPGDVRVTHLYVEVLRSVEVDAGGMPGGGVGGDGSVFGSRVFSSTVIRAAGA